MKIYIYIVDIFVFKIINATLVCLKMLKLFSNVFTLLTSPATFCVHHNVNELRRYLLSPHTCLSAAVA